MGERWQFMTPEVARPPTMVYAGRPGEETIGARRCVLMNKIILLINGYLSLAIIPRLQGVPQKISEQARRRSSQDAVGVSRFA